MGSRAEEIDFAGQPKAFMPLLAGGHLLGDRHCTQDALGILVDWFDRTLR